MKKKGIFCIAFAVILATAFLWQETAVSRERALRKTVSYTERLTPDVAETPASTEMPAKTTAPPEAADTPSEDGEDKKDAGIKVEIKEEMFQQMHVEKNEFARQIQMYANASGYAEADSVKDRDVLTVDYGKKTITVPCLFILGEEKSPFDAIYHYEKKKWRFVPW